MATPSNNTTTAVVCNLPDWFPTAVKYASLASIDFGLPIHFFLATLPTCIIASAFYRAYITEKMYTFQRVLIINLSLNCLANDISTVAMRLWSGVSYKGADWFMSNYVLMWCTGHFAPQTVNALSMVSMILLIFMASDRILAISRPVYYRSLNYKLYSRSVICTAYLLGVSSSAFDIPRYDPIWRDVTYRLETNVAYVKLPVVDFLNNYRNGLNIACLILVIVLNIVAIVLLARLRKAKVHSAFNEPSRDRERRKLELNLLVMSISQGFAMALEKPLLVTFYIFTYTDPTFPACGNRLMGPVLEGYMKLCELLHLIILLSLNKPFYRLLARLAPLKQFFKISRSPTSNEKI